MAAVFFTPASAFIKCSICTMLLHIVTGRPITRAIIIGAGVLSVITAVTGTIMTLTNCRPFPYSWGQGEGSCDFRTRLANGYLQVVVAVIVDWILALIPVAILWNVQIERKVKIPLGIVLSMGGL